MQDQGLDLLHGVILRQKSMAQQIGVEVTQQNHLIDDIGERGKFFFFAGLRVLGTSLLMSPRYDFCGMPEFELRVLPLQAGALPT